ncbi:MAG: protein kinase [Planctomycetes bacterium]|nr:protein kinase [Planctomycetota bacterium]
MRRLEHPHVVGVRDAGTSADGRPYLVMDLVEGETLQARINRLGKISAHDVVETVRQLAGGLAAAHGLGLLHRDVKPENVLLRAMDGVALLTDFGLAKELDGVGGPTQTGQILGTPGYLAPEQLGHASSHGPPTDVYGLGATLYAMLTGHPPFRGETIVETFQATLRDEPEPPSRVSEVSPELEAVCLRCLRKAPEDRYSDAGDLLRALEAVDESGAQPRGVPRAALGGTLAALLLLGLGVAWAASSTTPGPTPTPTASASSSTPATLSAEEIRALIARAKHLLQEEDARGPEAARRAFTLAPDDPLALALMGLVYRRDRDFERARPLLDRAIQLVPTQADALTYRALLHDLQDRPDEARADLDRALEAAPLDSWVWARLASHKRGVDDAEGALKAIERAIAIEPDGRHFSIRALVWFMQGKSALALEDANLGVRKGPQYSMTWFVRAILKRTIRDPTSGQDLDEAIERDPRNLGALAARCNERLARSEFEGAIADATQALEIAPVLERSYYSAEALVDRGIAYLFSGRADLAIADLNRAQAHRPDDLDIENWRVDALFRGGKFRLALETLQAMLPRVKMAKPGRDDVISRLPKTFAVYLRIGLMHHLLGERQASFENLAQATATVGGKTPFPAIWRAAITGERGPLARFARLERWPGPLVRYFQRKLDREALLSVATRMGPAALGAAHTLLGVEAEGRGEAEVAKDHYRAALKADRPDLWEFAWAETRLRAL